VRLTYGLDDNTSDLVRITIAGGSPVLEVSFPLLGARTRNTNAGTTICNTPVELVDATSLVAAGQTRVITFTVDLDVLNMSALKFLHGIFDVFHTTVSTHLGGGDIGMETGTIPVAGNGLRGEGDSGAEFFSDTVEQEARHPELITHCGLSVQFFTIRLTVTLTVDAFARSDLVLPLGGHNLSIDTGDVDLSIETSLVVSLDNISAVDLASSNTTVVRTLRAWETTLGPAVWPAIGAEKGVFLLQTKPELMVGIGLHKPSTVVAEVELVWRAICIPGLAED
jgi:hypothetical protein